MASQSDLLALRTRIMSVSINAIEYSNFDRPTSVLLARKSTVECTYKIAPLRAHLISVAKAEEKKKQ